MKRSSDLNKALIQEGGKRCRLASKRLLCRTCQTSADLFVKDFMTPFIKDFKIHLSLCNFVYLITLMNFCSRFYFLSLLVNSCKACLAKDDPNSWVEEHSPGRIMSNHSIDGRMNPDSHAPDGSVATPFPSCPGWRGDKGSTPPGPEVFKFSRSQSRESAKISRFLSKACRGTRLTTDS